MNIFGCCPKKPKMPLDYVIKWVEETDKTLKEVVAWVQEIKEMNLQKVFDDYARDEYDWSQVPEFDAKADKVENAVLGHIASLDANGNLVDSGSGIDEAIEDGNMDLATCNAVYVALQGKADSVHTHSGIEDVVEGQQYAKVYADNQRQGEPSVIIELNDSNTPGSSVTKSANINIDNIDNFNRALTTPSSTPENDASKLITSKAVYDALTGKADVLKTLCINYDGQSQAETNYPISSSDKTLISAFIESVSENQYVPVIVMLIDENHTDGAVIGLAKWSISTSDNTSSIGVEVTIGKYKYTCDDYTVQDIECWYRTAIGQYHLS